MLGTPVDTTTRRNPLGHLTHRLKPPKEHTVSADGCRFTGSLIPTIVARPRQPQTAQFSTGLDKRWRFWRVQ